MKTKEEILGEKINEISDKTMEERILVSMDEFAKEVLSSYLTTALGIDKEVADVSAIGFIKEGTYLFTLSNPENIKP